MNFLRCFILASGIIPLFAWEGRVFQVTGKKVTIASSQTSGVRAGTMLYILKEGKEVGQGRVGNVFHTKVEMTLTGGVAEKDLIATTNRPSAAMVASTKLKPGKIVVQWAKNKPTTDGTSCVRTCARVGLEPMVGGIITTAVTGDARNLICRAFISKGSAFGSRAGYNWNGSIGTNVQPGCTIVHGGGYMHNKDFECLCQEGSDEAPLVLE